MREDLLPELQKRGLATLYADLWADRTRDPAGLINDAIKAGLRATDNRATKILKSTGLSKLSLGPFATFDIDKIGIPQGVTLTDALQALAQKARKPVALIVDEAQHALTTEAGTNSMFALKAARDAMNQGNSAYGLTLVFTGSQRDKLTHLMLRRDQPFFGASFLDFPLLGEDYCVAYTNWLNQRLAADNRFETEDVFAAFKILGHQPEMLQKILLEFAFGPSAAPGLKRTLATGATALRDRLREDFDREYAQLNAIQQAILQQLIENGEKFAPFTTATLEAVSIFAGEPLDTSKMQTALDGLRQKNLIWRSARATYVLEDQSMAEWYRARPAAASVSVAGKITAKKTSSAKKGPAK